MKLHLTRLTVNAGGDPNRPRPGRMWMQNPYRIHQRLAMAFPDVSRTPRGRQCSVLFRIEGGPRHHVLVQSTHEPDWDKAFRNALFLLAGSPEVKAFQPVFSEGQRFRFLLRANPTVKRKRVSDGKSVRMGLTSPKRKVSGFRERPSKGGGGPKAFALPPPVPAFRDAAE